MGAVDAWRKALVDIEKMKLNGIRFGGLADIATFFDQVRRGVVYKMAAAGMPPNILRADTPYI